MIKIAILIQPCKVSQASNGILSRFAKYRTSRFSRLVNGTGQILFKVRAVSRATMGIEGGQLEDCTSPTHRDWRF